MDLNQHLFLLINSCHVNGFTVGLARFFAEVPIYLSAALLVGNWLLARPQERGPALAIPCAAVILIVMHTLIRHHWYHPRPFAIGMGCAFLTHDPNSSFPSNHLGIIFACATAAVLLPRFRQVAIAVFVLCLPIAWSRIFAGVHWPYDMFGAIVTGGISGLLGHAVVRAVIARRQQAPRQAARVAARVRQRGPH
ncbi:phosphatase PAP2 family protein [Chitinasiproducens palmae]|uniref:Undecaprenyl-diphosphatase n=1 Tax=Chitinasiproducens palmae TaxID=1770053 RepID=A0A1H2PP54_9BURK|nr:phosphatase PAP2 family protein [Chitinasiproducens palmae]SDV48409.1 Undecaprenyl-diphosphatase [Chitinasiproducens palmae]